MDIDFDFDEEEPLSEGNRIKLIDETIKHRQELDFPNAEGFSDYLLRTQMNDECLKCNRSKPNLGQCYGKMGGNPCLVFVEMEDKPNVVSV
jgi:hypothetical protein